MSFCLLELDFAPFHEDFEQGRLSDLCRDSAQVEAVEEQVVQAAYSAHSHVGASILSLVLAKVDVNGWQSHTLNLGRCYCPCKTNWEVCSLNRSS